MRVKIINKTEFELPKYETFGSAGMDLMANLVDMDDKVFYDYDYINHQSYGFISTIDTGRTYKDGIWLKPHKQYIIPTGIFIALPKPSVEIASGEGFGYEAQIRPRSGMAANHGITVVNSPGTIDPDYRGEIKIILMNLTETPFKISHGDRIAQMVINRFERVAFDVVDNLDETDRGEGGFGHTGK